MTKTSTHAQSLKKASSSRETSHTSQRTHALSFTEKVRDIVRGIPTGKTMTYKEVATKAGNAKAARAVGAIMRTNYDPDIPCHRVVRSDGGMGGYNRGGSLRKKEILAHEGWKN